MAKKAHADQFTNMLHNNDSHKQFRRFKTVHLISGKEPRHLRRVIRLFCNSDTQILF